MSKITFDEIIESVARESDKSKSFTRAFLKDLTKAIRSELENGEKVNIAGLGKFELENVAEKEGYNPQTDERMTIPAHHKVVFKPYKNLRETVNAPYAHLEPQLIDEDSIDSRDEDAEEQQAETATHPPVNRVFNVAKMPGRPADKSLRNETLSDWSLWISAGAGVAGLAIVAAGAWLFFRRNK
ncbi:MAG TPA: HU family DNA-binding protein [Balneolaceae bacterium]|nr:HU family DNA-binding protein [Balneolaceae bacterium]